MPRLTNNLYLERHRFVAMAWTDFRPVFTVVPMDQQWDVHRYFQTTSSASDADLLSNRAELTRLDPSLPQRASKAFTRIYEAFRFAYEYAQGDQAKFYRAVRRQAPIPVHARSQQTAWVRPLVRPEPDVQKLVQALLRLAEQQRQAEADEEQLPPAA